ncbi:MAG: hypothetical protein UH211_09345 [Agathobacter sp.]|nr:hypothetical protein [Agathobacter sp.]
MIPVYSLIQETQKLVEIGIKIGNETSEYFTKVVTQTETIDEEVTKIANTTMSQKERVPLPVKN